MQSFKPQPKVLLVKHTFISVIQSSRSGYWPDPWEYLSTYVLETMRSLSKHAALFLSSPLFHSLSLSSWEFVLNQIHMAQKVLASICTWHTEELVLEFHFLQADQKGAGREGWEGPRKAGNKTENQGATRLHPFFKKSGSPGAVCQAGLLCTA